MFFYFKTGMNKFSEEEQSSTTKFNQMLYAISYLPTTNITYVQLKCTKSSVVVW